MTTVNTCKTPPSRTELEITRDLVGCRVPNWTDGDSMGPRKWEINGNGPTPRNAPNHNPARHFLALLVMLVLSTLTGCADVPMASTDPTLVEAHTSEPATQPEMISVMAVPFSELAHGPLCDGIGDVRWMLASDGTAKLIPGATALRSNWAQPRSGTWGVIDQQLWLSFDDGTNEQQTVIRREDGSYLFISGPKMTLLRECPSDEAVAIIAGEHRASNGFLIQLSANGYVAYVDGHAQGGIWDSDPSDPRVAIITWIGSNGLPGEVSTSIRFGEPSNEPIKVEPTHYTLTAQDLINGHSFCDEQNQRWVFAADGTLKIDEVLSGTWSLTANKYAGEGTLTTTLWMADEVPHASYQPMTVTRSMKATSEGYTLTLYNTDITLRRCALLPGMGI
jgi:hypothetical protein